MLSTLRAVFPPSSPTYDLLTSLLSLFTTHPLYILATSFLLPITLSLLTLVYIQLFNPDLAPKMHKTWKTRTNTHLFLKLTLEHFLCIVLGLGSVVVFGGTLGWSVDWLLFWVGECCGGGASMAVLAALAVLGCAAFVKVCALARPVCGNDDEERYGDVEGAGTGREKDELSVYEDIAGDDIVFVLEKKC
jgi:hypothetical protein